MTSTPIEEHGFPLSPLLDWLPQIPGRLLVPEEFLSDPCFSQTVRPTPSVEMEVTIQYPVAKLSRYIDNLPMIVEQLRKLGPDGGSFEFGYDILPEHSHLDDPKDADIFTGAPTTSWIIF